MTCTLLLLERVRFDFVVEKSLRAREEDNELRPPRATGDKTPEDVEPEDCPERPRCGGSLTRGGSVGAAGGAAPLAGAGEAELGVLENNVTCSCPEFPIALWPSEADTNSST